MDFDWLTENGRLWTPESTAFWLEPETEAELVSWFRKYRPSFRGRIQCADFDVIITDPPPPPFNPYANAYQAGALQNAFYHQQLLHSASQQAQLGAFGLFGSALGQLFR